MLHQKRFAQLAPLVHPVRGLALEDAENVVPSASFADFVRRKLTFSVTCGAQPMSFASYVETMVRRTSIDYTRPRDVHLDGRSLRDGGIRGLEGRTPRAVIETTADEDAAGFVHQLVLYFARHHDAWFLVGIYTTDHHACG